MSLGNAIGIGIGPFGGTVATPKTILGSKLVAWYRADLGVTLLEGAMSQPLDLDHADWNENNVTVDTGGIADPEGGTDAHTITTVGDVATQTRYIFQSPQNQRLAPSHFTFYAKKIDLDWVYVRNPAVGLVFFDLANGVVGTETVPDTGTITDMGDGWYKCEATFAAGNAVFIYGVSNADNIITWVDPVGGDETLFHNCNFVYTDGGGLVSAWADQSGNGNDQLQGTGAPQPVYVASGGGAPNDVPYIEYDGTDDYTEASFSSPQPNMVWIVCTPNVTAPVLQQTVYDGNAVNTRRMYMGNTPDIRWYAGTNAIYGAEPDVTGWAKFRTLWNDTSSEIQVNADSEQSASLGTGASTGVLLGTSPPKTSTYFANTRIFEFIITNADCTADEQAAIEAYIDARVGAL